MFGRNVAMPVMPANVSTKTPTASHCRRRPRSSATSSAEPFSARSGILGHHDDVARLEEEVLVLPVRRDDLVVVEGNPLHPDSVEPEDEDSPAGCEVVERPGLADNAHPARPALYLVTP